MRHRCDVDADAAAPPRLLLTRLCDKHLKARSKGACAAPSARRRGAEEGLRLMHGACALAVSAGAECCARTHTHSAHTTSRVTF